MIYLRSISRFNYFFAFFFSFHYLIITHFWNDSHRCNCQIKCQMQYQLMARHREKKNDETITGVQLQWICKVSADKERRANVILRSDLCKKVTTVVYFVCLFASVLLFLSFFRHTLFFSWKTLLDTQQYRSWCFASLVPVSRVLSITLVCNAIHNFLFVLHSRVFPAFFLSCPLLYALISAFFPSFYSLQEVYSSPPTHSPCQPL